jgi:hypothetical protein
MYLQIMSVFLQTPDAPPMSMLLTPNRASIYYQDGRIYDVPEGIERPEDVKVT